MRAETPRTAHPLRQVRGVRCQTRTPLHDQEHLGVDNHWENQLDCFVYCYGMTTSLNLIDSGAGRNLIFKKDLPSDFAERFTDT